MTPDHQNEPPQFHIGIDCADPGSLAPFWAAALGYELGTPISDGVYLMLKPPDPSHPVVYFQKVPEGKAREARVDCAGGRSLVVVPSYPPRPEPRRSRTVCTSTSEPLRRRSSSIG